MLQATIFLVRLILVIFFSSVLKIKKIYNRKQTKKRTS